MKFAYLIAALFSWFITFTCVPQLLSAPSWGMMFLGVLQSVASIIMTLIVVDKFSTTSITPTTTKGPTE